MLELGTDHCYLDATGLERFDERFPTIAAAVRAVGLDPTRDWLPVAPAAHHLCGGVLTDLDGATALAGLWACGECACSGVHGANRLASNSLLEGMVFAPRVVEAIGRGKEGPEPTGAMRAVLGGAGDYIGGRRIALPEVPPRQGTPAHSPAKAREELQRAMTEGAGVLRSASSLARAASLVGAIDATDHELANLRSVALALIAAATEREESRGAHTRTDHPHTRDELRVRLVV
jgi:L-aspartate oxidase